MEAKWMSWKILFFVFSFFFTYYIGFNLFDRWGTKCNLIHVQDKMSSKISINMTICQHCCFFFLFFPFFNLFSWINVHMNMNIYIRIGWMKQRLKLISFCSSSFCFNGFNFYKTHKMIWNHFSCNLLLSKAFSTEHIRFFFLKLDVSDSNGDIFKLKKKIVSNMKCSKRIYTKYAEIRVSKQNFMPFNLYSNLTLDLMWILMYISKSDDEIFLGKCRQDGRTPIMSSKWFWWH